MKKKLSEEFKRMQKIAGIVKENQMDNDLSREEIINKIQNLQDSSNYTTEEASEFKLGDYFVQRYEDLKGEGEFAVWNELQRQDSDPQPYLETDSPEEVADFLLSKFNEN